jgi:2-amino-4-hydroxy-6-hydroxymethyldihydropteridine diphosphokinase
MRESPHHYLIALGSNRRGGKAASPRAVLAQALAAIDMPVVVRSRIIDTAPLGPGTRRYANAAAIIMSRLSPDDLLEHLKQIERSFGRKRGRRWGDRVLDLDIILWSGGIWVSPELAVPHVSFRDRDFVLSPAAEIAGAWRDPLTGLKISHLKARLDRKRPRN